MKRILSTLLLSLLAYCGVAQTATVVSITPPCTGNGVIGVNTSGLTPPLTFYYYYGFYGMVIPMTTHSGVLTTSDTLSSWVGGDVTIYVSDASTSAYVTYNGGPLGISFTSVSNTCPTPSTLTATVSGGTSPYAYRWYNSSGTLVGSTNPLSTTRSGDYYLVATDAAGCFLDSRYVADSSNRIHSTPPFTYSVNSTTASCTNGTASVTGISGGTTPYSYIWSNGATSSSISGLITGSYQVVVSDASGCSSDSVYVFVSQTPYVSAYVTPTPATCLDTDGVVVAFGSGGVSPYTYRWSNGATTQTQSGLASGAYNVTVTDANGCIGEGYGYVGVATPITVTYTTTPSSCTSATGSATLSIAGGTTPYSITWYTVPVQTGATATSLPAGTYGFKVTDAVGCIRTGTVYIPPVAILTPSFSISPATCTASNGAVGVSVSGGATPYSYSWSTGSAASGISSLAAGTYSVTITDANGCRIVKYPYVPVYSPITLGLSPTIASCLYTSDGSITVTPAGGTAPYTYGWSSGATTPTASSLGTGWYTIYVTDAAGCTAADDLYLGYNTANDFCYCTIKGKVYFDANGNCTQDAGETGIHNIQIHCSTMGYAYTDTGGNYAFKVPTGSYTLSQNILSFYPLSACQSNSISASVTASSGCFHTVNFADTINPIHDMHMSTWDYSWPVPGNSYTQVSIVSNDGTISESSALSGYQTDGQLFAPTFVPTGTYSSGATNWYTSGSSFPSLTPGAAASYLMTYNVPTTIPLGTSVLFKDSVSYTSPMTNWLTDYSPWNNVNYFNATVVSSYDPNFKEVSPKGSGSNGMITYKDSVLEYMVHFQNTGTWYAQKVVVVDTLDADLDWTTLRPVFQSHKCDVTVSEAGVATFTFDHINLPAQTMDDLRSNGLFTYTIKTRRNLAIGTQIKNKAGIYFDYNSPIYTNTTLNTIGWPLSILENGYGNGEENSLALYPNPAENNFNVVINAVSAGENMIRVTDITGKTLSAKAINLEIGKHTVQMDATRFSAGTYFVTLTSGGKSTTQKLVIMK